MKKHLFKTGLMAMALTLTSQTVWADWWNDVKNNRYDTIEKELANGQDPNELNKEGHPAIIYAVREDSKDAYMLLAKNPKTDVNLANKFDETPLMYAAIIGDIDFAKALIQRGAKVNRLGWAPLHYAAANGKTKMVEFLLSQGAFPNAPSADGTSPIMMAVSSGKLDTVKVLLAAGADPKAINQVHKSAIDLARDQQKTSILKVLEGK
ncbi:ankyrin [Pelistega indica]|uniref:Ankyrin n=1 Tax=Pelistega indica TaxID=1414851 RepID=V8G5L9_9BURK|nr:MULTISPECIES: ankyrin repeat domain-containing protein [Pelistega]ETD71710.1 ankyrin [Pelistega indica]